MSYEVEQKFRIDDVQSVESALMRLDAVPLDLSMLQSDHYLAHPCRDFAATNEAFRVRVEADRCFVTYKGPRLEGPAKTRLEIELAIGAGAASEAESLRLFEALGFVRTATVRKRRSSFAIPAADPPILCTIDEVEGLGRFVEVEAIAEGPDDLDAARDAVIRVAAQLGLENPEPRSYLRMLLESRAG